MCKCHIKILHQAVDHERADERHDPLQIIAYCYFVFDYCAKMVSIVI